MPRYINDAPGPSGLLVFSAPGSGGAEVFEFGHDLVHDVCNSIGIMLQGFGMTGTTRSSAGLDPRRRRLLYRCWHRGTREMDLIMGRFADATIDTLSEAEVALLEVLSEAPDPDLYAWISGGCEVPVEYDHGLMRRLRTFHHSGAT